MATAQATAQSRPALLTLPQELQDLIFDYAYPTVPNIRYLSRRQWEAKRELMSMKTDQAPAPFPELKVNDFLVSKLFFQNAARAYVDYQVLRAPEDAVGTVSTLTDMTAGGIFFAFVKEIQCKGFWLFNVCKLPQLRRLTVQLMVDDFQGLGLTPADHVKLYAEDFARLLGLPWLTRDMWDGNLKRLEDYVKQQVLRPKAAISSPKISAGKPIVLEQIYHGSAVCFINSGLVTMKRAEVLNIPNFQQFPDIGLTGGKKSEGRPRTVSCGSNPRSLMVALAKHGSIQAEFRKRALVDDNMLEDFEEFRELENTGGAGLLGWMYKAKKVKLGGR